MKMFVIQGKPAKERLIPAQSYGYSAIEAVEYSNWFCREQVYDYVLTDNIRFRSSAVGAPEAIDYNYLKSNYVPIGSVEFVLEWLKLMGINSVSPLNIPQELWKFCEREICLVNNLVELNGEWMVKDRNRIKSNHNRGLRLPQDIQGNYFATKWIDNVVSEWRVFIIDKEVRGIRCYSGDEWILPNKDYINTIVDTYDKRCYTLDVMVQDDGHTEIVELHDFFSCGLYGFEDYAVLPKMWITTINELLKGANK